MKSLRSQLLLILTGFVFVSILTALYTARHFEEKEEITSLSDQLSAFEVDLLKAFKEQENFFNFETHNQTYFETQKSIYLENYQSIFKRLVRRTDSLVKTNKLDSSTFDKLERINNQLSSFDSLFQITTLIIRERGFRNYGIEGRMREAIHQLEDISVLDLVDILTLRRHEKDFILRQDSTYLDRHNYAASLLRKKINFSPFLTKSEKESILSTLSNYTNLFGLLAELEIKIGIKSNTGLKSKINTSINQLIISLSDLKGAAQTHQKELLYKQNIYIIAFWVIYVVLVIFLSLKVSKKFTQRLQVLSNRINYFVNTNFTSRLDLKPIGGSDEVTILWNNIMKMEKEIVDYLNLFKEKVDEKTLELSFKNEKIELQKQELEEKKKESDQKNKDLIDGMKYGWRLQSALLPSTDRLNKQLKEGFVFFAPKDIVSGDVYWSHKTIKKQGEECIFSVIDCTGHGVPGAFMSILAINAINDSTLNKKYREPQHIIQATNDYVYSTMKYNLNKKDSNLSKEGMDMMVCNLNRKLNLLKYSGANRSLIIIRKAETESDNKIGLNEEDYKMTKSEHHHLFEIKASKNTVGTLSREQSSKFIGKRIYVQPKDMIYLTTDGYADQFGGPKGKKYMTKRLKNLLIEIHDLDSKKQREVIKQSFYNWKQDSEQIDDVSILAVRV
ncbi:MAG: SpoIIE family protein phosphatase [Vicingaceae bacterium]